MRLGVRWAETMRVSWATPRASRVSAAWCMVVQSDWLPMMMPTSGPFLGEPEGRRDGARPALACDFLAALRAAIRTIPGPGGEAPDYRCRSLENKPSG